MGQVNCTFSVAAAAGDTCDSLCRDWAITRDQFNTYNPGVESSCATGLTVGKNYCVEATIVKPSTGSSSSSSSSSSPSTSSAATTTLITITTTTSPSGPSPTQPGLTFQCQKFYKVQSGDTCDAIVSRYRTFTTSDLILWNPAVGSSCTSLWVDYYICVGVPGTPSQPPVTTTTAASGPSPTQSGLIGSCNRFYQVASGDTCQSIQSKYNTFSLSDFYKWNPAVGTSCTSLWSSYFVCIGVPGTPTMATSTTHSPTPTPNGPQPQQPGIPNSCNRWHLVQSGDYCQKLADQYHIALRDFYKWNPSVGSDCKSLWGGYNVCVGVGSQVRRGTGQASSSC